MLKLWMPCTTDLRNQGLTNYQSAQTTGWGVKPNGKVGSCLKLTSYLENLLPMTEWDVNQTSVTMCGWFYFPSAEIAEVVNALPVTAQKTTPTGNLIGYNSYGGAAIVYVTNDVYNDGGFTMIKLAMMMRQGSTVYVDRYYTPPLDQWVHIAAVINRETQKSLLYINGSQYGNPMNLAWLPETVINTKSLCISYPVIYGGNGPAFSCPCYINDIRVYDEALDAKTISEIGKGLVLHYPLNDPYIEGTTNLITSLKAGGKTSVIDGTKIQTAGESGDTYFYFNTQALTSGTTYTVSCYCSGLLPNVEYARFGVGSQSAGNASHCGYLDFRNGFNYLTFTCPEALNGKTQIIFDDLSGDWRDSVLTLSNLQLEAKDHPTGYTAFGTTRGRASTAFDTSGYQHNGIIGGEPEPSPDTAKYACSTKFGTGNFIRTVESPTGEIQTLSAWCKTTANKNTSQFVCADWGSKLCITFYSGTIITYFGATNYSTGSRCTLGSSYKENDWNHIVVIKTGGGTRDVYCNGVKLTPTNNDFWSPAEGFYVGARAASGTLPFQGYISDVRAYTTKLTEEQILELYHTSASLTSNGLLYTYELQEV